MQKKMIIPVLAVIAGGVLAIGTSAFTKARYKTKVHQTTDYFQFKGTNEMSGTITSAGNWTFLSTSAPNSNPCDPGTDLVCVVNVLDANLTAPGTIEEKFADYLSHVSGGAPAYVESHFNFKKVQP